MNIILKDLKEKNIYFKLKLDFQEEFKKEITL